MSPTAPTSSTLATLQLRSALPWRRAIVLGAGRSGVAAARLLHSYGVEVQVHDARAQAWPPTNTASSLDHPGWHEGVAFVSGDAALEDALGAGPDLIVLSPGVPPQRPRAIAAKFCPGAAVHGEMSLALALLDGRVPTVLITGTNGKSTVTAMVGHLLEAGGLRPFVGGNLGVPLCEALLELSGQAPSQRPAALVLECSSFQLETMHDVPCDVAMVLNITPDHLDRYPSMDEYAAAKAQILEGLIAGGTALFSATDAWTPRLRSAVPDHGRTLEIGASDAPKLADSDGALELASDERIEREVLPLAGSHNAVNALFALTAARTLGVSLATCREALATFRGLPHRMEAVATIREVAYFDDSKATNVTSSLAGLRGFPRPYVLIAGGRAKGDSLDDLGLELRQHARALVAIGEAAHDFLALTQGEIPSRHAASMPEAVEIAAQLAQPGDAVILSPACASYDMFRNYAHRGEVFCAAVHGLREVAEPAR